MGLAESLTSNLSHPEIQVRRSLSVARYGYCPDYTTQSHSNIRLKDMITFLVLSRSFFTFIVKFDLTSVREWVN